jgi:DNA invertase Pin-like site-specific DNA recombinase
MPIIGYARVSTDGQSLDNQMAALRAAGAGKVFSEKMSGARSDRPQLARMLKALQADDVVIVAKLDRLARSTRDLLSTLQAITQRGAGFKVLDNPTLDTTSPHGRLLINILATIGEFERDLIMTRTNEGRKRAMANGKRFADGAPDCEGPAAARCRRGTHRDRAQLQRLPQHDIEAAARPEGAVEERADGVPKAAQSKETVAVGVREGERVIDDVGVAVPRLPVHRVGHERVGAHHAADQRS